MNAKLSPRESLVLYVVWIGVAFCFFLLGLYWGKSHTEGLGEARREEAPSSVQTVQTESRLDFSEPAKEPGAEYPSNAGA